MCHEKYSRLKTVSSLPRVSMMFVGYGASDTGTRNWGRGSRISLCTSAVHTYTIYIRLHNLKKKRAFSISYNRSPSHCWTFISSVRSSSGYHGLLHTRKQPTFSDFSNSSDSKVKVKVKGPNMCYIFEKHGIQGYRI